MSSEKYIIKQYMCIYVKEICFISTQNEKGMPFCDFMAFEVNP